MSYQFTQVKEAFLKFKSYVYYDNADVLLRRQLVEFESNLSKDSTFYQIINKVPKPYGEHKNKFKKANSIIDLKIEILTESINNYHTKPEFLEYFLDQISIYHFPKKIAQSPIEENFITNEKVKESYSIERVTCFINAPIELHILNVLWIMEYGINFEKKLSSCCLGNRLLVNKENDEIIKGSGLFKPYHNQYKKWRDDSVATAQSILKKGKNVLFLNLDIRDYFHSVRIKTNLLFDPKERYSHIMSGYYNLKKVFLATHLKYTILLGKKYEVPYPFYDKLEKDTNGNIKEVILPIGLLSSYVLANYYLKEFDDRIEQKIKPAYYGRYVDDILILIEDPKRDYNDLETIEELKFSFEKYKSDFNEGAENEELSVSFKESEMTSLEKFVLQNFHPLFQLIDTPTFISDNIQESISKKEKVFKLLGYPSLYCQSKKSLGYFFNHEDSNLVIDKLKRELEDKSSEFRDFPDDQNANESFEESAYHLLYDGNDNKVRTLKDYKENRYGLTIYLANKIFSALRHEKKITVEEKDEVLKFFRGETCLNFYRLWERIFTFFLVNNHSEAYVQFYIHCLEEIGKIKNEVPMTSVTSELIQQTLVDYLDGVHEIAISLNPNFISSAKKASRHFEFQIKKLQHQDYLLWLDFEPTKNKSYWATRYRKVNMMRQNYVIHPLLTYTDESRKNNIDLTSLSLDIKKYSLDDYLIENSPRFVKFWECCMAIVFEEMKDFKPQQSKLDDGYVSTNILGLKEKLSLLDKKGDDIDEFYLDKVFDLYKRINQNHIPTYELGDENFKDKFFKREIDPLKYDHIKTTKVQEITIPHFENIRTPKVVFANTEVEENSIIQSLRNAPNLSLGRYQKLSSILKKAREENSDILLFPEFFMPVNLLSSVIRHSEKNQMLTVLGLEHVVIDKVAFNFIVTILPVEVDGTTDAVVVFRLKNHYAHIEESLIVGNHLLIPKPTPYRYDIFNWRNVYFSTFYCFELANSLHRSLMKSKIDLLIGIEWNRDTPYFSNIVEAGSRDLHSFVAQVNTSQFGDTRLTQPVETARKDILRLKGGKNDAILVSSIDIEKLREFQRQKFSITHPKGEFKPLPPDFSLTDVLRRINNKSIFKE